MSSIQNGRNNAFFFLILLLFFFGGCLAPLPKPSLPPEVEQPDYRPKKTFSFNFPLAWKITLQALEENQIPIASRDQNLGIIRTDFQPGPDVFLVSTPVSARHKFTIIFFQETLGKTFLNIRCILEVKGIYGNSYADATKAFPKEVIELERRLYQLIDSRLIAYEAPLNKEEAGPLPIAKAEVIPSPAPQTSAAIEPASPRADETPAVPPGKIFPPSGTPPPKDPETPPLRPPAPPEATVVSPVPSPAASSPAQAAIQEGPKPESEEKVPVIYLVTLHNAKMRSKPSTTGEIVFILRKGRAIEKIGESGSWYQVKLWGKTGWISKSLVQESR
jgi:hypothetical protein